MTRRRLDSLEVLTVAEVAAILRVRRALVYGLLRRSELRGVKVGSVWRVPRAALEEFFAGEREAVRVSTASLILETFRRDDVWRTAHEVGALLMIRVREAREALAALTYSGELRFEVGPEGRHPFARCWRLAEPDEAVREAVRAIVDDKGELRA